jgi:hypothetical protein
VCLIRHRGAMACERTDWAFLGLGVPRTPMVVVRRIRMKCLEVLSQDRIEARNQPVTGILALTCCFQRSFVAFIRILRSTT